MVEVGEAHLATNITEQDANNPQTDVAFPKTPDETVEPPQYPLAGEGSRRAWSHEVLPNHRPHKHTEMEYSVPAARGLACFMAIRDLLHKGYCISSCGSQAFSNKRDDNGVSKRSSGVWYHAMAYLGCDDRETTRAKYGEPLVMIQNSWGRWNTGSRKVMNSVLEIPEGGFWARWSDIKKRYCVAFSGVVGWPAQTLPDWGLGDVL